MVVSGILIILPNSPFVTIAHANSSWTQTNDIDFYGGTLNNVTIVGTGSDAHVQLGLVDINSWTNKNPNQKPSGRLYHAMATISNNDTIVLFGGFDTGGKDNETWVYDLSANSWTNKNPLGLRPSARTKHAMATIYNDDKIVLFGGHDSNGYNDETWIYDLSANTWTKMNPTIKPTARSYHTMATIYNDDKVILFGGWDESYLGDIWIYDLSLNSWTIKNPYGAKPSARYNHAMATVYNDDKVILFGGGDDNGYDNETWIYDLSTNRWTNNNPLGSNPSARFDHALAGVYNDDKFVLFGGYDLRGLNDETWVYDLSANSWTRIHPSTKPSSREEPVMTTIYTDDKVVLFGGYDNWYDGETWAFDFAGFGSGEFISKAFDTNAKSNFGKITWNAITSANTDVKFQLRTALTQEVLSSKNFMGPSGSVSAFYTTSGSLVWSGHDGDRWIQYKAFFNSIDPEQTSTLKDITIEYDCQPNPPIITTPENDVWTNNNKPSFNWKFSDLDSASQQGFQWQMDNDISFESINYDSGDVNSNMSSYVHTSSIPDGIWNWRVRTQDNEGNWGPYSDKSIVKIDTSIKKPINIVIDPNTWTSINLFNVNWTNPNDLSGIKDGAYYFIGDLPPMSQTDGIWTDHKPIDISNVPEGSSYLYLWLEDQAGNRNYLNYESCILNYDSTSPDQLFITINNGTKFTNTKTIDLKINAVDTLSNVKDMSFSFDEKEWSNWEPFSTSKSMTIPEGDGEKIVYLKVKDKAGNIAQTSNSIILDTEPPNSLSINIKSRLDMTNTRNVTLKLIAKDNLSGVHEMAFSSDGKIWSDWEDYLDEKYFILPANDGEKSIYFKVKDKAGNIAQASDTVILDTNPPYSLKILINGGSSETNSTIVSLDLEAFDDITGVSKMSFSYDNTTWTKWEPFNFEKSFTLPSGDGEKTIYFRAQDMSGNVAETTFATILLKTKTTIIDSDGDNYRDSLDAFPQDSTQWLDTDGDNYGDNLIGNNPDYFPNDPKRWSKEDGENNDEYSYWIIILVISVVIIFTVLFLFVFRSRLNKKSTERGELSQEYFQEEYIPKTPKPSHAYSSTPQYPKYIRPRYRPAQQELRPETNDLKKLIKQGSIAYSHGHYKDAILAWQQVIEMEPGKHPEIELAIIDALKKVKK